MKSRKFQDVTSIVASLIFVCLLRSGLVAPCHVVAVGPAALCSACLQSATSLRKTESLRLLCMLQYPKLGYALTIT